VPITGEIAWLHYHVLLRTMWQLLMIAILILPLGTVRSLYRTGVSLHPREGFYIFNQKIYFII